LTTFSFLFFVPFSSHFLSSFNFIGINFSDLFYASVFLSGLGRRFFFFHRLLTLIGPIFFSIFVAFLLEPLLVTTSLFPPCVPFTFSVKCFRHWRLFFISFPFFPAFFPEIFFSLGLSRPRPAAEFQDHSFSISWECQFFSTVLVRVRGPPYPFFFLFSFWTSVGPLFFVAFYLTPHLMVFPLLPGLPSSSFPSFFQRFFPPMHFFFSTLSSPTLQVRAFAEVTIFFILHHMSQFPLFEVSTWVELL